MLWSVLSLFILFYSDFFYGAKIGMQFNCFCISWDFSSCPPRNEKKRERIGMNLICIIIWRNKRRQSKYFLLILFFLFLLPHQQKKKYFHYAITKQNQKRFKFLKWDNPALSKFQCFNFVNENQMRFLSKMRLNINETWSNLSTCKLKF